VLSEFFPEQRAQLDAMVTQAGLSRMYGGIHYRFDIEAGQMLGRSVAHFAIAADRAGHSVLNADIDEDYGDDEGDDDGNNPIVARANLNVRLRGVGHGFIRFRQPADAFFTVFLDTRVRGLAANTDYQLQRATDALVDDNCTGINWLTLGRLSVPLVIHTDAQGKGAALFSRDLTSAVGGQFDIHFRVIDAVSKAIVLESGCYQFKVSQ